MLNIIDIALETVPAEQVLFEIEMERLLMSSFKDGVRAGESGGDIHPPEHNWIMDKLMSVSEECVEQMRSDYFRGVEVGTQRRLANALKEEEDP